MRPVMTRRVALVLAPAVWRTLPWRTLGATGTVGLLPAALCRLLGAEPGGSSALSLLRFAALALALGAAFLLDDTARHTTAPVPTGRAARTVLRVVLVLPVAALWWTAALLLVTGPAGPPAGDLTLEAATAFAVAVAAATVAVRHTDRTDPGRTVAVGLVTAAILVPVMQPSRWALFVWPADPRWAAAHERWGWVLAVAVAVWGLSLPEPRTRRSLRLAITSPCSTSGPSGGR
ncbi:ABC transporter [Streptomyces sp. NPDC005209]|uniref:ABC transporter n=1 Tax=Streptomyces sp. NPDC005209 TaxID=3156715 RepID=UPI0033B97D02